MMPGNWFTNLFISQTAKLDVQKIKSQAPKTKQIPISNFQNRKRYS